MIMAQNPNPTPTSVQGQVETFFPAEIVWKNCAKITSFGENDDDNDALAVMHFTVENCRPASQNPQRGRVEGVVPRVVV